MIKCKDFKGVKEQVEVF